IAGARWPYPPEADFARELWDRVSVNKGGSSGKIKKKRICRGLQSLIDGGIPLEKVLRAADRLGKDIESAIYNPDLLEPGTPTEEGTKEPEESESDLEVTVVGPSASASSITEAASSSSTAVVRERPVNILLPDGVEILVWEGGRWQTQSVLQKAPFADRFLFIDNYNTLSRAREGTTESLGRIPSANIALLENLRAEKPRGLQLHLLSFLVTPARRQELLDTLHATPELSNLLDSVIITPSKRGWNGKAAVLKAFDAPNQTLLADDDQGICEEVWEQWAGIPLHIKLRNKPACSEGIEEVQFLEGIRDQEIREYKVLPKPGWFQLNMQRKLINQGL
ncbi:unnamed protein product, partial [Symbiodinium sp. KB8]